jgi:hypothetical protein
MLATKYHHLVPATVDASFHALVCRKVLFSLDDITTPLPRAITNLLHEFKDVFPTEIPRGLPPLRGIEHQIYLIQELLNHGYVQENLSPCVIPVILVSKKNGT